MSAREPVAPRNPAREQELRREQEHFDRVLERIAVLRDEAARHERSTLATPTGESPQDVYERDVAVLAAAARRAELDLIGDGLLFGRLDTAEGSVLHVGRLGVRTEAQEPLIIDWRAPAASAFYQATAAEPLGVVRRRTITTRAEQVTGIEDELVDPERADQLAGTVVVGDGAFMAAVSRERGPHMRDIVATIQAEQDRAVRAPDRGALIVTGGPGTGKTAVALHRVAYLLYSRRDYYARRDVLVVGPSPVFVDYISQVLPALGETSVRLTSIGTLPDLPGGLRVAGHDAPAVAVVKGSARMAAVLRAVVDRLGRPSSVPELRLTRHGVELRVRGGELLRRRERVVRSVRTYNAGRAALADGLVDLAWRAWTRRAGATRIEADDRSDFAAWLRDEPAFLASLDALWPVLEPGPVFARLRRGEAWQQVARDVFSTAEVAALATAWRAAATSPTVTPADAAILDELRALLGPPPQPEPDEDDDDYLEELARSTQVSTSYDQISPARTPEPDDDVTYAHVVVDEAQDVTPMQWRMIGRRAGAATWTIVGDWAQSAWPDVQEVRDALGACLGRAPVREASLSTNYRTSTEIADVAARVLARIDADAVPPAAVRSTGEEPRLRGPVDVAGELPDEVGRLLREVNGTVAVICPYDEVAASQDVLSELLDREPRLSVLDTWAIKGLEFDACVVVAPEGIVAEGLTPTAGLRSLYVALTRATQRLTVLSDRPLAELLAEEESAA